MMRTFYYSFMFCAAFLLASCTSGEEGSSYGIELTGDTKKEIVLNADDNTHTLTFKAPAPWSATVKDVTTSRAEETNSPDWIQLSDYSGEAGDVTVSISFTKNLTGVSRKAEIIIICGGNTITITIEQKAESSTGTIIKPVKTLEYEQLYYSEIIDNPDVEFGKSVAVFNYDENGRVESINVTEDGSLMSEATMDYSVADKINISIKYPSDPQAGTEVVLTLDDKGNAVKVLSKENVQSDYTDMASLEYTEDGRIGRLTLWNEHYDEYEIYSFNYENGYLTKMKDENVDTEDGEILFDIPEFYPNNYPNNGMIDMFAFLDITNGFDYALWIGRTGRTGDYILEKVINTKAYDEIAPGFSRTVPKDEYNPGDKIGDGYTSTNVRFDEYSTLECEYDNGNLSKLTRKLRYDVVKKTYHEVVTDRIISNIDGDYYITETQLVGTEKIDEGYDYDIYTFTY